MVQIPYLDVQKLSKRFGAQVLFDEISFSIAEGQHVGLIAKNGTGKSTLLSILTAAWNKARSSTPKSRFSTLVSTIRATRTRY